jgi:branched-chain amino acid aminotransferase
MAAKLVDVKWIWKEGELVPWWEANVHILSIAVQFGASVFEGIRCYKTPDGPAIFRLDEHLRRLVDSCRIYRMEMGYSQDEIRQACLDTVRKNELQEAYVRPMVLRGYGDAGMAPIHSPIETYIACWPWGTYLGVEALRTGVDARVAGWNRPAPNTFPTLAKAAGHYNNAMLIKMEAVADGYAEAIALGPDGLVSEGSGQNVFLVRDGTIYTPAVDGTLLHGITRGAILQIAQDLGYQTSETRIPREALYTADELFYGGTATEVTPIRSVDRIQIGSGTGGPITLAIQERFLGIARGELPDTHGWLTRV